MVGRPSKCTPELCERICKHIRKGNYPTTAAALEGIPKATMSRWMKKGRESKTQSGKYWNFWNSIKKAKYEGEAHAVEGIKAAGEKNWTAYAWLLERMYPDRWGKRQRVEMEHSGKVEKEVKGELKIEVSDESRKLAAKLSRSIHSKNDRSPKSGGD